jgi:acyl carrier protein
MLSTTSLSPALHKLAEKTFSATQLSLRSTRDQLKEKFCYLVNGWAILPVSIAYGAVQYIWKWTNPGNELAKLLFLTFSPEGLEQQFKTIIARETEIPLDEIQPHVAFANLGVDSLLGLSITAAIEREMGLSLPPSFFMEDNIKVNDAMEFLKSITNKPQAI